ncbi:hypothetical protein ACFPRJ_41075 [Streptomyces nigrescens]|uniref:hypothetical protein n=1 Tax=Streptomyces nigrescens TaxID=1920 RepID=UPI0036168DB6
MTTNEAPDTAVQKARERLQAAIAHHPHRPDQTDEADRRLLSEATWRKVRELGSPWEEPGERLYVLGFNGPVPYVKAGRSKHMKKRLARHETDAAIHGAFLYDGWASPPYLTVRDWETAALRAMRRLPHPVTRVGEYFHNLDFEQAVGVAQRAKPLFMDILSIWDRDGLS